MPESRLHDGQTILDGIIQQGCLPARLEHHITPYGARYVREELTGELVELYLKDARLAGHCNRVDRMVFASQEFARRHPEYGIAQACCDVHSLTQR